MRSRFVSLLFTVLLCGCAHKSASYVVGDVYSTGPVGDLPLYGLHKVLAVDPRQLFVYQVIETFGARPTSLSQFPTNEDVVPGQYFRISYKDFERRQPVLIGTLPLTKEENDAVSSK